jgi:hypothetical protein
MPLRDLLRRWSRSLLFIPALVLLAIVILAAFRVNGSSIGALSETDPSPQALFHVRPIRSDEWHLRTPMVVHQAALDFARTSDIGMGVHDVGTLLDFPVRSPAVVVKPNSWPYFVVGVEHAFAFEWWLTVLGPFLGVYATLAVLTRSRAVSALSGVLASAAPVAAWWTVPWLGLSVLYAGVMAAAVIRGAQLQDRRRYVLFVLGGWAAACFVAQLYLPWIVPLGLLFGAIIVTQLPRAFRRWRPFAAAAVCCIGTFAVLLAIFFREHQVAIKAIQDSVYPGRRTTTSGFGSPVLMFDAPFDWLSLHARETVSTTNQSEASSGLMLWFPIALVGGGFSGIRSRIGANRALAVVLAVALILTAWALLPVPTTLGKLLGLTVVQGSRIVVGLTIAGALAAGLYVHRLRTDPTFRPPRSRLIIAALTFAAFTAWSGAHMTIDDLPLPTAKVLLLTLLFSAAVLAMLHGRLVLGIGAACALTLFSTARVNPVQIGLDPLTRNPLMAQVRAVQATSPGARWAAMHGDIVGFSVLAASGVPASTGFDLYAVPDVWHRFDPTDASEHVWNRVANIDISIDNSVAQPQIVSPVADLILIVTPSCNGVLQALGVRYITDTDPTDAPCLTEVDRPDRVGERWIYEVSS